MEPSPRIAIVLNEGRWFVRRIALVHQDDTRGEMVYHCDENLGGPFLSIDEAADTAEAYLQSVSNRGRYLAGYPMAADDLHVLKATPREVLGVLWREGMREPK